MGLPVVRYVTKVWLKLLLAEVWEGFKDIPVFQFMLQKGVYCYAIHCVTFLFEILSLLQTQFMKFCSICLENITCFSDDFI